MRIRRLLSKVPLYKVKTPLQRSVQLLKRHRDIMCEGLPHDRKDNAPISIIITTLAASAYNNEANLYEALSNILSNTEKYIERDGDKYIIENPVMKEENFAKKWNEKPEKAKEFFAWLNSAKIDILQAPINALGLHKVSEKFLNTALDIISYKRSMIADGDSMRVSREDRTLYVGVLTGRLHTSPTENLKKWEDILSLDSKARCYKSTQFNKRLLFVQTSKVQPAVLIKIKTSCFGLGEFGQHCFLRDMP